MIVLVWQRIYRRFVAAHSASRRPQTGPTLMCPTVSVCLSLSLSLCHRLVRVQLIKSVSKQLCALTITFKRSPPSSDVDHLEVGPVRLWLTLSNKIDYLSN